jgi:hypothetical protein
MVGRVFLRLGRHRPGVRSGEVTDVVQQGGQHHLVVRTIAARQQGALQGVIELAHAVVVPARTPLQEIDDVHALSALLTTRSYPCSNGGCYRVMTPG